MSKGNSAFNSAHCEVYQDMTKPLTFYWIASSHNTLVNNHVFTSGGIFISDSFYVCELVTVTKGYW